MSMKKVPQVLRESPTKLTILAKFVILSGWASVPLGDVLKLKLRFHKSSSQIN